MSFQISQRLMEWNLGVKKSSTKFWWIFIINFRWWFRAKPYRFCDLFGKKIKKMMVDTCFEDGRNHQNKKTVMIVHWIYWIAFVNFNGPMTLTWKILIRIYQRRMNVKPSEGINIPSREVKQGPGTSGKFCKTPYVFPWEKNTTLFRSSEILRLESLYIGDSLSKQWLSRDI